MRSYKINLSLQDIYFGVVCVFPISTMLIDGGIWNKLMFAILSITHMGMLIMRPVKRKTVIVFLILAVQYVFVLYKTQFPMDNSNLLFYYPFFIVYTYYMVDNMTVLSNWFAKNKQYVHTIILAWTVLVGISIFLPNCYYIKEGGRLYFGSFCEDIFRLGPSAVFIQVLVLLSQTMYKNKKAIWFMLVPMYCFYMGSSRTYLAIGLFLLMISWYITAGKKLFWSTALPLGLALLMLIWVSPLGDKIRYTLDESRYGDFWFRVTSSRSVIWAECLKEWKQTSIVNQLFGNDLGFTFHVTGHWAHNDFIEILCTYGIVGLMTYLISIRSLYKRAFNKVHLPVVISICVFMVWFFNAFFNMHYVYFCTMLSYPILMVAVYTWGKTLNIVAANVKN